MLDKVFESISMCTTVLLYTTGTSFTMKVIVIVTCTSWKLKVTSIVVVTLWNGSLVDTFTYTTTLQNLLFGWF